MEMNESTTPEPDADHAKHVIEACLLVAGRALSLRELEALFQDDTPQPGKEHLRAALTSLQEDYEGRGIELVEVASGWRLQSRVSMEPWVSRLFKEKSPRYSRALLETLVLVAYRQPITRGEIEDVRGVAVSSNIIKTLQEREWVREVGHKDVPGKPALLGTTRQFLDYFNLKRLEDLPSLGDLKDLDQIDDALGKELAAELGVVDSTAANDESGERGSGDEADVTRADDAPDGDAGDGSSSDADSSDEAHDGEQASDDAGEGVTDVDSVDLLLPESVPVDLTQFLEPDGVQSEDVQSEDVQSEDVQSEDVQSEDVQSEDVQTEDPQARLRRVVDEFAGEHRQELEAERQVLPARKSADADEAVPTDVAPAVTSNTELEAELETADTSPAERSRPDRNDTVP